MSVTIQLNGEPFEVQSNTVAALVEQLQMAEQKFAIEINREIIPRSQFAEYELGEGDKVEIVRAIGGG